jgi:hypothetical protein
MKKRNLFIVTVFITFLIGCSNIPEVKYAESLSNNEKYEVILMGGKAVPKYHCYY